MSQQTKSHAGKLPCSCPLVHPIFARNYRDLFRGSRVGENCQFACSLHRHGRHDLPKKEENFDIIGIPRTQLTCMAVIANRDAPSLLCEVAEGDLRCRNKGRSSKRFLFRSLTRIGSSPFLLREYAGELRFVFRCAHVARGGGLPRGPRIWQETFRISLTRTSS